MLIEYTQKHKEGIPSVIHVLRHSESRVTVELCTQPDLKDDVKRYMINRMVDVGGVAPFTTDDVKGWE